MTTHEQIMQTAVDKASAMLCDIHKVDKEEDLMYQDESGDMYFYEYYQDHFNDLYDYFLNKLKTNLV